MAIFQRATPPKHHQLQAVEALPRDGEASAEAIDMRVNESVTDDEFRTVMRQVVSSVAIVTARSGKVRNGLTATAVCSVSAEPPAMLICVNRRATADGLIAESGAFAINVLTEDQHQIARLFSTSKLGRRALCRRQMGIDGHRCAGAGRRGGSVRLPGPGADRLRYASHLYRARRGGSLARPARAALSGRPVP